MGLKVKTLKASSKKLSSSARGERSRLVCEALHLEKMKRMEDK